ncbi:hypothetical protein GGS20DRAFT_587999 [Poronia punctata]|nr:hypothetical protein GGS20DRAFT_587999 [Poronia punctata]
MFGTFKFNEKTRLSDNIDGIDSRSYIRTLRCDGERKSCERCLATSTPCTYTLSSGPGRSKKRVRRHLFSDAAIGCFPVETERADDDNTARQRSAGVNQESARAPTTRPSDTSKKDRTVAPISPESSGPPATSTADSVWPESGTDLSGMLAFADEGDFLALGDNSDLSEESFLSGHDPRAWDPFLARDYLPGLPRGAPPASDAGRSLTRMLQIEESKSGKLASGPGPWDHGRSDSMAGSLPSSATCGCLSNVAQLFETIVSRTASYAEQSIDMLMIDLDDGVSGCKKVLVCGECTACSDNPTLLATVGSHLVGLWDGITSRIVACQRQSRASTGSQNSPEPQDETEVSSAQTFRYGRYAVQSAEMKCHLLNNLIQLHFDHINELLSYMKIAVRQNPSAVEIVERAAAKATRIGLEMRREVGGPRSDDKFIRKESISTRDYTTHSR